MHHSRALSWRPLRLAAVSLFVFAVGGVCAGPAGAVATPCPSVSAPTTLPNAQAAAAYDYQVPGCGSFTISHGTLPGTLTLSSDGRISGTAPATVQTAIVTIQASQPAAAVRHGVHADIATAASEQVALPVTQTVNVDPAGGEITGMANDGSLVYAAGSSAGDVFDLDASAPDVHRTALTGMNFPAAVSAYQGTLYVAQFGEPETAGSPIASGPTPASASTSSLPAVQRHDGDTRCAGADGVGNGTIPPGLGTPGILYTCARSDLISWGSPDNSVTEYSPEPYAGGHGVPSGVAHVSDFSYLVADARNNTVTLTADGPFDQINLPAGSKPANIAYDSVHGKAYVADPGTGHVSIIVMPPPSGGVMTYGGDIVVGHAPYGVAVNAAGTSLVVTNSGDDTADVISLTGATPTIEYAPGAGTKPDGVTIVGSDAFIGDEVGGTVTVIDPPAGRGLRRRLRILHPRIRPRVNRAAAASFPVVGDPLIAPLQGGAR